MSTQAMKYIHQSLAASGFAILDGEVATTLRPDLFVTGLECAGSLGEARRRNLHKGLPGVTLMDAKLAGLERSILVLTRSRDNLEQRIEWVTGRRVESLAPAVEPMPTAQPESFQEQEQRRMAASRLQRIRSLAEQEPPAHDCALRKDILAARAELQRAA